MCNYIAPISCVKSWYVTAFVNLILHIQNSGRFQVYLVGQLIGSERVVDKLPNAIFSERDYNVA